MTEKLSERVERLEGPNREIFIEAFVAIHGPKPERVHGGSRELTDWLLLFNPFFHLLEAKGWLSAAEMLVPEGCVWGVSNRDPDPWMFRASVVPVMVAAGEAQAATPANALLAAILKARGL